jgi:hypothetical protein
VARQQFSVKFDNQPSCEKKALKQETFECKKCKAYLNCFSELTKKSVNLLDPNAGKKLRLSDARMQQIKQTSSLWIC